MPYSKVLGFRALDFAVAYGIFFHIFHLQFLKCYFSFFWAAARKIARLPEKIILPDSWGGLSPTHTPMKRSITETTPHDSPGNLVF